MSKISIRRRIAGLTVAASASAALVIATTPGTAGASTTSAPPVVGVSGQGTSLDQGSITDALGMDISGMNNQALPPDQIMQLLGQLTGQVGQGLNLPLGLGG